MRCQLCGFEFEAGLGSRCLACPLGASCTTICCPNCGYQTIDESQSRAAGLLKAVWSALGTRVTVAEPFQARRAFRNRQAKERQ
jgi:hypothetical protein